MQIPADFWVILKPFAIPALLVLCVVAGVWGFVEWATFWISSEVKREATRRYLCLVLGELVVGCIHRYGVYDFGAGPAGWVRAMALGILTLPFAKLFHDQVVVRFLPWLQAQNVVAAVTSISKPTN